MQDADEDGGESTPADTAVDDGTNNDGAADLADEIRVQHKLANVALAVKRQIDGMDAVMSEGSLYYNRALQPRMAPQAVTRGYISNREALVALAEH